MLEVKLEHMIMLQFDAAGSADNNLQMDRVKNLIDVSQLRFLALSQQLPQLPWAVSRFLSPELRMQIHEILITMDQTDKGRAALHAASLDKIIPAHDRDFDPFREITRTIRGEQF